DSCVSSGCASTCPADHCGDGLYQPQCGEQCDASERAVCSGAPFSGLSCSTASRCECCVAGSMGFRSPAGTPPCCDGSACVPVSPIACACGNFCWPSGSSCLNTALCCSGGACPPSGFCP